MKIIRPLQLGFNSRVIEQNQKFHFIASVTLGVDLSTAEALLEMDYIKNAMDCMGDKPILDTGMPKPEAEILVSGSFFSPKQEQVEGGQVRVQLGELDKTLTVFGPRRWQHGLPTRPELMNVMPIDFAHAFGGTDYAKNPVGIGHDDGQLPFIENPDRIVPSMRH